MNQWEAQAQEEERRRQEEEQRRQEEEQRKAEEAQRQAEQEAKKAAEKAAAEQAKQAQDRQARIDANKKAAEETARKNAERDQYWNRPDRQSGSLADLERAHNQWIDQNRNDPSNPRNMKGAERAEYYSDYIHDKIPSLQKPEQQITGSPEDLQRQYAEKNGVSLEEAKRAYEEGMGNAAIQAPGQKASPEETQRLIQQEKIDQWLSPDYKMSKDERREAQGIVRDFNRQYGSQGQLADRDAAAQIAALDNKSRALGSFNAGLMRPIMNATNAVQKGADWLLGGSAELGAGMIDDLAGTNLAGAVQNARGQINEAQDQNNAFLRDTYQNAQAQNNLAYQGGNLAGNAALYAATNPIFDSLGAAAGLGKVGGAVLNQVGQNAQDIALDTIPNYIANVEAGMSPDEAAREARNGVLMNAAGNALVGGALPILGKGVDAIRGLRNSNAAEQILKDADNVIPALKNPAEDTARQLDPAAMARQNAEGVEDILAQRQAAVDEVRRIAREQSLGLPQNDIEGQERRVLEQIEKYRNGEFPGHELINMGETPRYLSDFGDVDNDVRLKQKKLKEITSPKQEGTHRHGLTDEEVAGYVRDANSPVAVYQSPTMPDSPVIVGDRVDTDGNQIVSSLGLDRKYKTDGKTTILTSEYGKDTVGEQLKNARQDGRMKFENKEKVDQLISNRGLGSPKLNTNTDLLSDSNVTPAVDAVKAQNATSMDPGHDLANRYAAAFDNVDTYGYMDDLDAIEGGIEQMAKDINEGKDLTQYIDALRGYVDEVEIPEQKAEIEGLIKELSDRNPAQGPQLNTASQAIKEAMNLQPTKDESRFLDTAWSGQGSLRKQLTTPDTEMSDMTYDMFNSDIREALSRYNYKGNAKLEQAAKDMTDSLDEYRAAMDAGDKAVAEAQAKKINAALHRFNYNANKAGIEGYDGAFGKAALNKSVGQPAHYMKDISEADPFGKLEEYVGTFEPLGDEYTRKMESIPLARDAWNDIMQEVEKRADLTQPGAKDAYDHFWDAAMDQATRGDNATRKQFAEAYNDMRQFMGNDVPEEKLDKMLNLDLQLFSNDPDEEIKAAMNAAKEARLNEIESQVATNTVRRSGLFNDQEYEELIEPISKYVPQSETETMELAKQRLINDHDGTLDRYLRENPNVKKFGAADVDTMMLALYEQREIMRNSTDDVARQAARENIRKLGLTLRKTGTENGRAIQAFAKWTRTADGAVAAADAQAAGQVQDFLTKNPRLAKEIDDVAGEISERVKGLFQGQPTPENRQQVIDMINEVLDGNKKVGKRINDDGVNRIADSIMKGNAYDDIHNQLEFLSTGFTDVSDDVIDQVTKLFDEMEGLDFNSKKYVQKEQEAFGLLANSISHGGKFKDKFDQWRYFSMLANPTTHIRNLVGNATFRGINGAKDTLAAAIEKSADMVSKATGHGGIGRTKSILTPGDKSLVDACRADGFQNAYRELTGNKYTGAARGIEGQMPAWNPQKAGGRFMNRLTGANTAALNKEDELFVFNKFQNAMAGFLKANGADASIFTKDDTASRELVEQARNYAIGQAKIAAFHQDGAFGSTATSFAQGVKNWRNSDNRIKSALGLAADITIPFKKTPANILESALAYSPFELAKTFTEDTYKLAKGTMKAADYIDDLSKGLTGTAGLALGAILAREGILAVNTRQSDRSSNFDKQTGRQNLAIKVGDTYIGLDQLIPAAAPLIYGATVYDAMNGNDDNALDAIVTGSTALANGVTDMTMLSGIADALSSVRYANSDADVWGAVGNNLAGNLASQLLPTLGRKIETTADDTRRSTYTDKTGSLSKFASQEGKYLSTKIPGLQKAGEEMQKSDNQVIKSLGEKVALEPDIDAKGQERKNTGGDSLGLRAVNNFLNPLNITKDKSTPLDDERRRLADATGNDKLIPSIATSESKVGDHKLTPKEWTEYRKERGQNREEMSEAFFKTKGYKDLSDADKANVYATIDSLTKNLAQEDYGKELTTKDQRYKGIYEKDGAEAVVKAIRDDFILSDIAKEAGGEDAKVTDKLREIYDTKGADAAKEYASAYKNAGDGKGSPSIQEVLDYAKANPKVSKETLEALMPKSSTGTLAKEKGEWVYKDKNGNVSKTGMTEKERRVAEKEAKIQEGKSKDLSTYGLDKKSVVSTYEKAQKTIPSLTTKQFADTYKKIDSNSNQGITQKELIAYMNDAKLSKDEGAQVWSAYGSDSWKKTANYSNGQWNLSGGSGKSGGSSTASSAAYQKAVQAFGSGFSTSDYKNTKSAIDTDGNGKLKKAEVKAYMDAHPEQADQIWAAYAQKNWKR